LLNKGFLAKISLHVAAVFETGSKQAFHRDNPAFI